MQVTLQEAEIKALITEVVEQVLARSQHDGPFTNRLAISEKEAAAALGLTQNVLRDERLRGRIKASQIVGSRIRYTKEDLVGYLSGRPFVIRVKSPD